VNFFTKTREISSKLLHYSYNFCFLHSVEYLCFCYNLRNNFTFQIQFETSSYLQAKIQTIFKQTQRNFLQNSTQTSPRNLHFPNLHHTTKFSNENSIQTLPSPSAPSIRCTSLTDFRTHNFLISEKNFFQLHCSEKSGNFH
jgi:hypothetical protein